jgi:hypothetical protein
MADSGLLISWGETYPGREEQALRLWNETREYYGSLLEADRISRFEPFLVAGRGAPLHGFMIVGGRRPAHLRAPDRNAPTRRVCRRSADDERLQPCHEGARRDPTARWTLMGRSSSHGPEWSPVHAVTGVQVPRNCEPSARRRPV